MTLSSPIGAVVAVHDVEKAVADLGRLGLVERSRHEDVVDLAAAERGQVRVVAARRRAISPGPFDRGPVALDLYSRDLSRSVAMAGLPAGPPVVVELGPMVMRQVRLAGPDGLPIVLIDTDHRRPSLLDHDEQALHSEAHSLVWVVDSIDEALPFWRDAGLSVAFDVPIESPAVCDLLSLPRRDVPVRMAMLTDAEQRPMRLELFEFPHDAGPAFDPTPRAGTTWPAFEVGDLDAALALPWASTGPVEAVAGQQVVRCVAPGGIVAELRA